MASGKFAGKYVPVIPPGRYVVRIVNGRAVIELPDNIEVDYRRVKENDGQPSNNLLMVAGKSANIEG